MIIAVDCGTTNMRCRLFEGDRHLDEIKAACGTRDAAFAGSNAPLEAALRDMLAALLQKNGLTNADVEMIVSAGTLASNAGVYHVPHAPAPIGVLESAAAARTVTLPHISSIPMLFIPGVRTAPKPNESDPMRAIELYDSMGGDLIAAVAEHTFLKNTLPSPVIREIDAKQ